METTLKTKGDGVHAAKKAIESYQEQINDLQTEQDAQRRDLQAASAQKREILAQIARTTLPSSEPTHLATASEYFGALHLAHTLELKKQEFETVLPAEKQALEAHAEFAEMRKNIAPKVGKLYLRREEIIENLQEHAKTIAYYEASAAFKKLAYRQDHYNTFAPRLLEYLTFSFTRINKFIQRAKTDLQTEDLAAAIQTYRTFQENHTELRAHYKELTARIESIEQLQSRYDELSYLLADKTRFLHESLVDALMAHLEGADAKLFFNKVPEAWQVYIAKLDALSQKEKYLKGIIKATEEEIKDRKAKIAGIQKVIPVWSRRPYAALSGDKSKWLVKLPQAKRQSTSKYTAHSRSMCSGIVEYDDYGSYQVLLTTGIAFIAYDAFASQAQGMPYDGFAQNILPEVADFREEMGQDRPDYSEMNAVLAEEGADVAPADAEEFGEEGSMSEEEEALDALVSESDTDDLEADVS